MNGLSCHAKIRAQQRGIPPEIDLWLDQYGREEYSGNGVVTVFFDKKSFTAMRRELGEDVVKLASSYLNCYKIVSVAGRFAVTIGFRTKHIRRK